MRLMIAASLVALIAGCNAVFGPDRCNGERAACEAAAEAAEGALPAAIAERGHTEVQIRFVGADDPEPCEAYGVCDEELHAIAVVQLTYPGRAGLETWSVTVTQSEPGAPFEPVAP